MDAKDDNILTEFCDSSTIHGVKYIGRRPLKEKVWWIIIFILSICVCCLQISSLYRKWERNPVVVSFDQQFSTVDDVPFPAVTLCTQIKFNATHLLDYFRTMQAGEEDLLDLLEVTSELCLKGSVKDQKMNVTSRFEGRSVIIMKNPMRREWSQRHDILKKCRGIVKPATWECSEEFMRIVTQNGICHTFNMLDRKSLLRENVLFDFDEHGNETYHWSSETGYSTNSPFSEIGEKRDFPHRTFIAGKKLQIKLAIYEGNWDSRCFLEPKVYIHHPYDLPWKSNSYVKLNEYSENTILVSPKVIVGNLDLQHSYTASQRKCYFEDERHLAYFKIYSESNCEMECLVNISRKFCECVAFWLPRPPGTAICGLTKQKCYTKTVYRYLGLEQASASFDPNTNYDIPFRCNCLPRCNSVSYTAELKDPHSTVNGYEDDEDETDEDNEPIKVGERTFVRFGIAINQDAKDIAVLPRNLTSKPVTFTVEFKEAQILPLKRSSLYGLSDFVAACGGLLGLFMGVSIVSIIEIFYFLTLRVFFR